jgi:hypothetical protein
MSASESPVTPGGPGAGSTPRWLWPVVAAATVLVLVIVGVVLLGDGDGGGGPGAAGTTTSAATTTAPTTTGTPSTAVSPTSATPETTSPPVAGRLAAPVYYVVDVEGVGPRLYREFHQVHAKGDKVVAALTEMFTGTPRDPDYQSMWPTSTRVLSVKRLGGGVVQVDLSGFVQLGASFEGAAVQQLVHTATAAEPSNPSVRLLVNGAVPPSGHMDWSEPVKRSAPLETLGNVWILSPVQGTTVSSPVKVSVYGTGWEGNVPLKVFKGSTEVASTNVTTMMGGFAEAQTTIDLPPGAYELRAYNDNGRDETLQLWDTKAFTVR